MVLTFVMFFPLNVSSMDINGLCIRYAKACGGIPTVGTFLVAVALSEAQPQLQFSPLPLPFETCGQKTRS